MLNMFSQDHLNLFLKNKKPRCCAQINILLIYIELAAFTKCLKILTLENSIAPKHLAFLLFCLPLAESDKVFTCICVGCLYY